MNLDKKINVIKAAINEIGNLNFNGLQHNTINRIIVSNGEYAIKVQDIEVINRVITKIANNEDGFKWVSSSSPETKYSINAKKIL